jgi:hypothetical protein
MTDFNEIFKKDDNTGKVCLLIKEKFDLNIESEFKEMGYRFDTLHEIRNLIDDTGYYSIGMEDMDLNFQDSEGLLELLIKFINKKIADIPDELEALENERSRARNWDDIQHFHETEALSEKEGKLNKVKAKLIREHNKLIKTKNK